MLSCPGNQCLIYLRSISLPLLVFSYPDTDIHLTRFEYPESSTTDESPRFSLKDEILELFASLDFFFCFSDIFDLILISRKFGCDVEIYICFTELLMEFMDIYLPIE